MINTNNIRNFCIIAHIDHGKSTLADRLIEFAGFVDKREIKDRTLDTLELEQERGITIKLQTARLQYDYHKEGSIFNGTYILNLIDTPGHVDFTYEVSRSVAACEGALLLVDATQGIQAQTLTNVYKALEHNLVIIPVVNKIDMDIAEVEKTKQEMIDAFGFLESDIILASGKTGIGTKEILDAIVERIPPPRSQATQDVITKALVFDAFFHEFKGVTALVKVVSGNINTQKDMYCIGSQTKFKPLEVGWMLPKMQKEEVLEHGEVGYIATGLKDIKKIHAGDTITIAEGNYTQVDPLLGYKIPKPMVFASLYPVDADDFPKFAEALEKLSLNDSAISFQKEYSPALGTGFVCGFLGLLHLEITQDRLEREYNIDLISTMPTVEFLVKLATKDYSKVPSINVANIDVSSNIAKIRTASEFPDKSLIEYIQEPWVRLEIFTPEEYIGSIMEICQQARGIYINTNYIGSKINNSRNVILIYEMPSLEIMTNFFDKLKSVSHGYASMDYSFLEYRNSDIVKVSILVNGEIAEPLCFLCHKENAYRRGKDLVERLKDLIPRQQFKVPIQAAIGGQIIAREDIPALRKDVLAKLYGGDVTRKLKLLEKQKKGKKKLKQIGNVEIPKEVFVEVLKLG